MFEKIRQTMRDALDAATPPEERRAVLAQMKETLVRARMGVEDLRIGVSSTRVRLGAERQELDTIARRRALAAGINDAETVAIAERFEAQQRAKVDVLARKLEAQEEELALVEHEVAEMTSELKAAVAGVDPGAQRPRMAEAGAGAGRDADPEGLREEIDAMGRRGGRAERESAADDMLAALKRRMGK